MKILKLTAENLKRIRAVEIVPTDDLVVISGANGQGKTSVMDAISFALGGAKASKETLRPIRDGEDEAKVTLELGDKDGVDMIVRRHWTESGTTVTVQAADGARYGSPQQVLDTFIGRLSFDPYEFANMDPKKQLKTLLELVELPFDPDELQAKRAGIFEHRTDVNRELKAVAARLDGAKKPPPGTGPQEEFSVGQIVSELRAAQEHERVVQDLKQAIESLEVNLDFKDRQIKELEEARAEIVMSIEEAKRDLERVTADDSEVPDIAEIQTRLETVEVVNQDIRDFNAKLELWAQFNAYEAEAKELTKQLEGIDNDKADALEHAQMPIAGLGFNEDGVTFNGLPFAQSSGAEKLRVSTAMAIALNPKLRVIRITDGSLLDRANMQFLKELAEANDFQIWIERVEDTEFMGVVIEDGLVAETEAW